MLPLMITAIENDDDRQLAAELYIRYRAVMLRRAGSILKEDDRAEEAVQEAMLRVIRCNWQGQGARRVHGGAKSPDRPPPDAFRWAGHAQMRRGIRP